MRLFMDRRDERSDALADEGDDEEVRMDEYARRHEDTIRYCLGDPEGAVRDGLGEIVSALGLDVDLDPDVDLE